jgi:hypothetical protein
MIASAMGGDQGNYSVVVSNFAGVTNSTEATLAFDSSALNILVQPRDDTVEAGSPASFSVLVSGISPIAYQWYHAGGPIAGATASSFALAAARPADAGSYTVLVTNAYRAITSAPAQLTVTPGAVPPLLVINRSGSDIIITFSAEAGRNYRLLSSLDLHVWSPIATNSTVTAGSLQFVLPIMVTPQTFFRVVTP